MIGAFGGDGSFAGKVGAGILASVAIWPRFPENSEGIIQLETGSKIHGTAMKR